MNRSFVILFLVLTTSITLFGQHEKTVHQTFEVEDATHISLKIAGDYEIVPWSGNQILSETNIKIFDATEGILEHFMKTGRYEIIADSSKMPTFHLYSKDMVRKEIRTKYLDCREVVNTRIFVPERFSREDGTIIANQVSDLNQEEPIDSTKNEADYWDED